MSTARTREQQAAVTARKRAERPQEPHRATGGRKSTTDRVGPVRGAERPSARLLREARERSAVLFVVLPYPPTTNNLYATVHGRRVKSEAARAYEALCAAAVRDALDPDMPLPPPPFALVIHVWTPDRRKRDLDGCLKAPIDNVFRALRTPAYPIDDSMVMELHAHKALDRERPRLTMVLSHFKG